MTCANFIIMISIFTLFTPDNPTILETYVTTMILATVESSFNCRIRVNANFEVVDGTSSQVL